MMSSEASQKKSPALFNSWSLLREAVLICLIGAALGLGVNYTVVMEVIHGRKPGAAVHQKDTGGAPAFAVTRDEVVQLLKNEALAVDARSRDIFAAGHLPGALSLPVGELDAALPAFMEKVSLETPLIVYCSGYGCPDSEDVAVRLMSAGFADVRVYEGGYPEWQDSGLPVEKGGHGE